MGHLPHLEIRIILKCNVRSRETLLLFIIVQDTYYYRLLLLYPFILSYFRNQTTCVMAVLLVTVAGIVTTHSLEARSIDAGDDVDFSAGPSISGITAGTGTALRSPQRLMAFDAGVAR